MIFDTHAHYDDEAFDEDRDVVLTLLKDANVASVVNVGASMESSKRALELSKQYDFVYCAVGVHPSETTDLTESDYEWLCNHVHENKVVAVGEIGLDYYWDTPEREHQKEWFIKQLHLAIQEEKPVIIHSRDAAADTLEIMKEAKEYAKSLNKSFTGVIHCFSYSVEMAREYVKMGFYLGVGGVVTFKNAKMIKEVVKEIPMEFIVLETDCPYLAPEPNRGTRNDSSNLKYVINMIADIKNLTPKEIIEQTEINAKTLYGIA
ncbi:MAG: TatD family hydrolase [Clostridiales bacterium]|nr:TatD family hydrolase [Clostridiales bacterium]